jgi:hypothetical protein
MADIQRPKLPLPPPLPLPSSGKARVVARSGGPSSLAHGGLWLRRQGVLLAAEHWRRGGALDSTAVTVVLVAAWPTLLSARRRRLLGLNYAGQI